jgi:hypothetical protein
VVEQSSRLCRYLCARDALSLVICQVAAVSRSFAVFRIPRAPPSIPSRAPVHQGVPS